MEKWITTWGMAHANMSHASPSYQDSTMRLAVYNNIRGTGLRVRFSNKEGKKEMNILEASIDGRPLAFQGKTAVTIQPGVELCSDVLEMAVLADTHLTVNVAFRGPAISGNSIGAAVQCSPKGNYVHATQFDPKQPNLNARFFGLEKAIVGISSIEVRAEQGATVVCFGDSITQQSKWTEPLGEYLARTYPGTVSLINMGIGGNRLLHGPMAVIGKSFGQAGKIRFQHDALDIPGVASVIFAIGTNDIGMSSEKMPKEYVTADMLIAELTKLAGECHDRGIKAFGSTILPRGGVMNHSPVQEQERQKLNAWLRSCDVFDGVFDFDVAVRDSGNPEIIEFTYDSGDHLHPSTDGGKAMFRCIVQTLENQAVTLW